MVPEKPIPEQDPITSKSYAAHYVIATIILIATLFWALWDEAWGQRPWKAFQEQWKTRYSAFLNTARSTSQKSEKQIESDSDYATLNAAWKKASQDSAPQAAEIRKKLDDASSRLLAVQSVFTDRRAYVNALTYELETSDSASAKASKQREIDKYKAQQATVEFPDGSKKRFNFQQLEETHNEIRDERTKLSLDLGDVLKPVTDARAKMDEYVTDHLVDLTAPQIDGLKKRAAEWDPTIVQVNVAEANIVDRCESCHMNSREPVKVTAAAMTERGAKKPDEYATALASHADPELLTIHAMAAPQPAWKRHTETTNTGYGPSIPERTHRRDARAATPPIWSLQAATCSLKPSMRVRISSGNGAATGAIGMKGMTKSRKI
jgi:hypothetical protein